MKIAIVGPGIMPIPPKGWGAVEILISDYKHELEKLGHEVYIINTPKANEIVKLCNDYNPDFVHIQYDEFWGTIQSINCPRIAITSHYGYIEQLLKPIARDYIGIFNGFVFSSNKAYIFALSENIKNMYVKYKVKSDRIVVTPNGARKDLFKYYSVPKYNDRSICVGKIEQRKRQYLIQKYDANVFFAGNIAMNAVEVGKNYLGEWDKQTLYDELTNYSNLVLLSDGEADPLVTKEALMAGLGLVVSEYATANLDLSKEFITIIPESKITDHDFVRNAIVKNRKISNSQRKEIRQYALDNFDWEKLVKKYVETIEGLK